MKKIKICHSKRYYLKGKIKHLNMSLCQIFLKPYEFDKETVQKEIDDAGNLYYYFSPKTIDSQTMQGVMLASIKI